MTKNEKKHLLESAAEELSALISIINTNMESEISCYDSESPDYYDYQTCYELMLMAKDYE